MPGVKDIGLFFWKSLTEWVSALTVKHLTEELAEGIRSPPGQLWALGAQI